jgi:hypothetical protein
MSLKEDILKLYRTGLSYSQISKQLGCTKSNISYHVRSDEDSRGKLKRRVEQRKNKMRRFIEDLKSSTPCMDCNVQYPSCVMDFDHRPDVVKKANVSQLNLFSSMEDLQNEISKCDLVCANCHRIRTRDRLVKLN